MLKNPDELSLIYVQRCDSTMPPVPCDGCYFHRVSGEALCAAGGKARCSVPDLDGTGCDYYIYKDEVAVIQAE